MELLFAATCVLGWLRDSYQVKNETARTEKYLITQLQQAKYLRQLLNKNLFSPWDTDRIKISWCRVTGSKNEPSNVITTMNLLQKGHLLDI